MFIVFSRRSNSIREVTRPSSGHVFGRGSEMAEMCPPQGGHWGADTCEKMKSWKNIFFWKIIVEVFFVDDVSCARRGKHGRGVTSREKNCCRRGKARQSTSTSPTAIDLWTQACVIIVVEVEWSRRWEHRRRRHFRAASRARGITLGLAHFSVEQFLVS